MKTKLVVLGLAASAMLLTPIIAGYLGWDGSLHFASFVVMFGVLVWFFIKPKS